MHFPSDCWLRVASLKKKGNFLSQLHIHHKSPKKSTQFFLSFSLCARNDQAPALQNTVDCQSRGKKEYEAA